MDHADELYRLTAAEPGLHESYRPVSGASPLAQVQERYRGRHLRLGQMAKGNYPFSARASRMPLESLTMSSNSPCTDSKKALVHSTGAAFLEDRER
jgi:hypothetical protein